MAQLLSHTVAEEILAVSGTILQFDLGIKLVAKGKIFFPGMLD